MPCPWETRLPTTSGDAVLQACHPQPVCLPTLSLCTPRNICTPRAMFNTRTGNKVRKSGLFCTSNLPDTGLSPHPKSGVDPAAQAITYLHPEPAGQNQATYDLKLKFYLHANNGVDEEEHCNEETHIRQGLWKRRRQC